MKRLHNTQGLFVALLLGISITIPATAENVNQSTDIEQSVTGIEHTATSSSTQGGSEFVEILPTDFRPAFTRATVIKLNKIVNQSYTVIREFDNFKKQFTKPPTQQLTQEESVKTVEKLQSAMIESLTARSETARVKMTEAIVDLKASSEYYNPAVLAGMVRFVETVDEEINLFFNKIANSDRHSKKRV